MSKVNEILVDLGNLGNEKITDVKVKRKKNKIKIILKTEISPTVYEPPSHSIAWCSELVKKTFDSARSSTEEKSNDDKS